MLVYISMLFILVCCLFLLNNEERYTNIKHKISILAILKNETLNLKIWLDHYIWQGITKFYLIDNDSTDNPLDILQPYIDKNIVSYYFLPEKFQQVKHYKDVIMNEDIKNKTEWLVVCDLDEFFYGYPNKLINIIDEYNNYDIIYSNWRMFGSDGLVEHPKDIRKSIVYREPDINNHTKYIVKINKINNINDINIHEVYNLNNFIIENEKIRLNHYPIQSLEFYNKVKMSRGDVANILSNNVRDMEYFDKYNQNKTHKDTDLLNLLE